jgi:hypothetical protein
MILNRQIWHDALDRAITEANQSGDAYICVRFARIVMEETVYAKSASTCTKELLTLREIVNKYGYGVEVEDQRDGYVEEYSIEGADSSCGGYLLKSHIPNKGCAGFLGDIKCWRVIKTPEIKTQEYQQDVILWCQLNTQVQPVEQLRDKTQIIGIALYPQQ